MIDGLPQRIRDRITIDNNGCWLWDKPRKDGYCQVTYDRRKWLVHRFTYTLLTGPIPPDLQIDHLCRVTRCVNPEHLEAVTPLVNTRRSRGNNSKTHCPSGHEYTPENTVNHDTRVHRECKVCRYERNAAWRRRHPGYVPPSRRRSHATAAEL